MWKLRACVRSSTRQSTRDNLEQLVDHLQAILESGVKFCDRRYHDDRDGYTPLRYAIVHDHDEAAEVIMRLQRRDLILEMYDATAASSRYESNAGKSKMVMSTFTPSFTFSLRKVSKSCAHVGHRTCYRE
jgi:hypothetical protein